MKEKEVKTCTRCQKIVTRTIKGMCKSCYEYLNRKKGKIIVCPVCKQTRVAWSRGLCHTCYNRYLQMKVEQHPRKCKRCGKIDGKFATKTICIACWPKSKEKRCNICSTLVQNTNKTGLCSKCYLEKLEQESINDVNIQYLIDTYID